MGQLMPILLPCALLAAAGGARAQDVDECLKQDSISCVQKSLFRKAKEFFEKESLELVAGVSLVRSPADRTSRSGKNLVYEQEIEQAAGVSDRQSALENFVGEQVSGFFGGRSLKINFAPALEKIGESARATSESVSTQVRQAVDEVVEGRVKRKYLSAILLPLLTAKLHVVLAAVLGYLVVGLVAKKAILASVVSIAVSVFLGLKDLWPSKSSGDVVAAEPAHSSSGWSPGAPSGWPGRSAPNQAYFGYRR